MNFIKKNLISIFICIFEMVVGVLLLVDPVMFTSGIIMGGGIVLIVLGVLFIMKYFRAEPAVAAKEQTLVKGLALILGGVFFVMNASWFLTLFPLLSILYGAVILIVGLSKIQAAVDLIRVKNEQWFWNAISAVITLICAAIILAKPFASTAVLWIFTGVVLIVEAGFDIVTIFLTNYTLKERKEEAKEKKNEDDWQQYLY